MLFILATGLSALYATLDPTSVSQHFAFYELYPKTEEGRQALKHAWELLSGGREISDPELILPSVGLEPILSLVNRPSGVETPKLDDASLKVIEKLSERLCNRKLKGHSVWTLKEVHDLKPDEIDLGRNLLIAEMGEQPDAKNKIRGYEASLDLMAL